MIAPMYLYVAVQAGFACHLGSCISSSTCRTQICAIADSCRRVPTRYMARGTQIGRPVLQQCGVVGTMRGMTVGAVIAGWRVFPQEWTAFFGVTGIAGLVHRVFMQQLRAAGTMRIVAIRAGHLAFLYRVMGGTVGLRALLLVTGEAHLNAHVAVRLVQVMAVRASKPRHVVGTAAPLCMSLVLMACQARAILVVCCRIRFLERFDFQRAAVVFLAGDFLVCGAAAMA